MQELPVFYSITTPPHPTPPHTFIFSPGCQMLQSFCTNFLVLCTTSYITCCVGYEVIFLLHLLLYLIFIISTKSSRWVPDSTNNSISLSYYNSQCACLSISACSFSSQMPGPIILKVSGITNRPGLVRIWIGLVL